MPRNNGELLENLIRFLLVPFMQVTFMHTATTRLYLAASELALNNT